MCICLFFLTVRFDSFIYLWADLHVYCDYIDLCIQFIYFSVFNQLLVFVFLFLFFTFTTLLLHIWTCLRVHELIFFLSFSYLLIDLSFVCGLLIR